MAKCEKDLRGKEHLLSFYLFIYLQLYSRPWKMDNDTEAPKDPGVLSQRYTEQDYEGNVGLDEIRETTMIKVCLIKFKNNNIFDKCLLLSLSRVGLYRSSSAFRVRGSSHAKQP